MIGEVAIITRHVLFPVEHHLDDLLPFVFTLEVGTTSARAVGAVAAGAGIRVDDRPICRISFQSSDLVDAVFGAAGADEEAGLYNWNELDLHDLFRSLVGWDGVPASG